jgi:hypothetical protein
MMSTSILHHPGQPATVPTAVSTAVGASFQNVYAAQEQTLWCWAACAQMVLSQLGVVPVPKQCDIACKRFALDCCSTPSICNFAHPIAEIEALYLRLGVSCRSVQAPLEEETLMVEVFAERPVQIHYAYRTSTVGHVVVVIGERNRRRTGLKYLQVADPREKNGKQTLLFDDVRTDSGKGTWTSTWISMMRIIP